MKMGKIGQVGIVVKDVAAAAKWISDNLGVGPFTMVDFTGGRAEYKGKTTAYKSKVAICGHEGLALELMQPYEGQTIQNDPDYLPPGGQGLHHLGWFVQDAEALAKQWEDEGGKVVQRSWPNENAMTIYLETREYSGILVELIQVGGLKK